MSIWSLLKHAFMKSWYWYVRILNTLWPYINLKGKRLIILPGVYKPLENEQACADYCRQGDRVLDLGCGCGVGSVFCSDHAREIVAVDINPLSVENTRENCERLGLSNVRVLQSDMFASVDGKFDLILANPPYIEADFPSREEQFATSVRYLPMLFAQVDNHLREGGRLLIQFPMWYRKRIEKLAAAHDLDLMSVRRLPRKSLGLFLLSLLYMQIGFRSSFFLLQARSQE